MGFFMFKCFWAVRVFKMQFFMQHKALPILYIILLELENRTRADFMPETFTTCQLYNIEHDTYLNGHGLIISDLVALIAGYELSVEDVVPALRAGELPAGHGRALVQDGGDHDVGPDHELTVDVVQSALFRCSGVGRGNHV